MASTGTTRPTVAVIGSGVAGLTAAHLLERDYDVHLFEADDRLGGHAHTHDVTTSDGGVARLDTGFLVHNERTYPHLIRLFAELGVATQDSEMSMSVRCDGCGLEYAGARGVRGLFAQPSALLRPRYLSLLGQVKRFHREARAELARPDTGELTTLGEFIDRGGYSEYFAHHFLLPVVSCVWSCGFDGARAYPARYLFAFLEHHGMLAVTGSPQWRTVVGGSRTYVDAVAARLTAVRTSTPVRAVLRHADGVSVWDDADRVHEVDRIVVATHPDQALALLGDATAEEKQVLGAFEYTTSDTVLHTDSRLLPLASGARASWNYQMDSCASDDRAVKVTYHLNRLQRVDDRRDYLVTLNDPGTIDPATVIDRMTYAHPTYTRESVAAQQLVPSINTERTAFAGAWQGWGFHEDGCASGVRAAAAHGVTW
ncbi:FAD-dependent oxidoreductase [Nakamurella flavida]|uniref:FAD-dependent oxidoreductase n=1 Tax=Nakamurella flavida TaxID=363630 RepID=A0A939C1M0_9ACTN|nr:FAD-dependent oxidoreductase [Nakamurella flavida]MBM9477838.1 FAD-dependent oxidoreductase [Nakamurella flavida]MDP9779392.1 putative NAD/FAD-binding protein [Nakamurella flavida]